MNVFSAPVYSGAALHGMPSVLGTEGTPTFHALHRNGGGNVFLVASNDERGVLLLYRSTHTLYP